ncbi:hypothetical protein [Actinacidiphila sp. bgisy160]|uniref:hypothetical protein n=1 Tax=Actinacidiphila sp. bgisy160 TaxID=3413796 RepID=UPI003D70E14D
MTFLEVACDESGSDGENLIGGNTDVFAHAGVCVAGEAAARALAEVRERIRSPAEEYKANHLLRDKHRAVLEWFLGPAGPLGGAASVHLVDKAWFVVVAVVDVLATGPSAAALATTLYREGRRTVDAARWREFLRAANELVRTRNHEAGVTPVDPFHRALGALDPADGAAGALSGVVEVLRRARPRAEAFRARLAAAPEAVDPLDPLFPALERTIARWSEGGARVHVVHDRQNSLTEERIARLGASLAPDRRPAGLRLAESRHDPRIQLADFLAGVARKLASDELAGRGDPVLIGLLRPYVDPLSVWGDDRSWSRLGPGSCPAGPQPPAAQLAPMSFVTRCASAME